MNRDITILIPTHFRHKYLRRVLEYYDLFDIPVVIADSTNDVYSGAEKLNKQKFTYLHFPGTTYPHKVNIALQQVQTKYVVFCADDDFLVPAAVQKCVQFLDNHPDYSSAQGYYTGFENVNSSFVFFPMYTNISDRAVNADSAEERLNDFMGNYIQLVYSVHLTENVKWLFANADGKLLNLNLFEFTRGYIPLIDGKHKVLPELFAFREKIPGSDGAVTDDLDVITTQERYRKEYENFIDLIAAYWSKQEGISQSLATEKIKASVDKYLQWHHAFMQAKKGSSGKSQLGFKDRLKIFIRDRIFRLYPMRYMINAQFKALAKMRSPGFPLHNEANRKALKQILQLLKKHNIIPA